MAYIFVGGAQRSGTSLLQLLLCQAPSTNAYLREASYLRMLVQNYHQAKAEFAGNHVDYFDDLADLCNFHGALVQAFLQRTQKRLQCEHLVLKEPVLTVYFPDLFQLVPQARLLLIVRDPRDAIASMVDVGNRQRERGQQSLFVQRDVASLCDYFRSFYEPALSSQNASFQAALSVLPYEDLVQHPDVMLQKLGDQLGLPLAEVEPQGPLNTGHLDYRQTQADPRFAPWQTELYGRPASASQVGRYSQVLTAEEIAIIEERCGDIMASFGYCHAA